MLAPRFDRIEDENVYVRTLSAKGSEERVCQMKRLSSQISADKKLHILFYR